MGQRMLVSLAVSQMAGDKVAFALIRGESQYCTMESYLGVYCTALGSS